MKNVRTAPSIPHAEYFPQPRSSNGPVRWAKLIRDDARELVKFWPVLQNMVTQELRTRYQRSVLGFLWTLINPILMMVVLTAVFSQLWGEDWRTYAVYLFAGTLPWGLFSGGLTEISHSIVANENLIRKIYLPKLIFPLAKLLINLTTFLLSMVSLYFVIWLLGSRFSTAMFLLPVAVGLLSAFTLGLGLVLAVVNTFFRDTSHLIGVILQAWYFATPIIYGQNGLNPAMQARCYFNPAYYFIRMFQLIIRDGQWPSLTMFSTAAAIATVSLGIGYVTFKSYENKFIYRL
jgi:ABC-type polysaccharide/polyol phosphate export permease